MLVNYKTGFGYEIITIAIKAGTGQLINLVTAFLITDINMFCKDIMQVFFGRNTESKNDQ